MKTIVHLDKIGGQGGKRIVCRLVRSTGEDCPNGYYIRFYGEKQTLFSDNYLLEFFFKVLDFNKDKLFRGDLNNPVVSGDYLLLEIEYTCGRIKDFTTIKVSDVSKLKRGLYNG